MGHDALLAIEPIVTMNTVLYSEGAVVATQPECIRKLEELGFGARRLYPMVLPAATSDTTFVCHSTVVQSKEGNVKDLDTSIGPLLLLDEEVDCMFMPNCF